MKGGEGGERGEERGERGEKRERGDIEGIQMNRSVIRAKPTAGIFENPAFIGDPRI